MASTEQALVSDGEGSAKSISEAILTIQFGSRSIEVDGSFLLLPAFWPAESTSASPKGASRVA